MNATMVVDLPGLSASAATIGAQLGLETDDLNATLLVWQPGTGVQEHVNDEVDVLIVAIEGEGVIVVDGKSFNLLAGQMIVVPKGATRSLTAATSRFAHLNVHQRRRKLALGTIPRREPSGRLEHPQP